MSEQDIYEIQITRCRMPSSTRYENLLSATSPTLEGIIDMVNEFYQEHKSARSDKQE